MLDTTHTKYENAFKQNGAAASLAAFYTEDAVLLPPETGPVYGREAAEAIAPSCRSYAATPTWTFGKSILVWATTLK
jgi:ketosteroid isomerase-like protein